MGCNKAPLAPVGSRFPLTGGGGVRKKEEVVLPRSRRIKTEVRESERDTKRSEGELPGFLRLFRFFLRTPKLYQFPNIAPQVEQTHLRHYTPHSLNCAYPEKGPSRPCGLRAGTTSGPISSSIVSWFPSHLLIPWDLKRRGPGGIQAEEGRKEKKKPNETPLPHPFKLVGGELLFDLVSIQR